MIYSCPADAHYEELLRQSSWYREASRLPNLNIFWVYAQPMDVQFRCEGEVLLVNAEEHYTKLSAKTYQMICAALAIDSSFDYLMKIDVTLVDYVCDHHEGEIADTLNFKTFEDWFWSPGFYREYNGICWLAERNTESLFQWARVKGIHIDPDKELVDGVVPGHYQGKSYVLARGVCEYIAAYGAEMSQRHCRYLGGSEDLFVGRMVRQMRASDARPRDEDLTFYVNTRGDAAQLPACLDTVRDSYARARLVIRSDGDPDPRLDEIGRWYAAEVYRGEWLFAIERGGEIVDEMLRLFLVEPTRWLFKIDPDTRIHRRFFELPEESCLFGTVQQQGGLYSLQGGCVGFTREAAEQLHVSGAVRDPALAQVPPPWAFNKALRMRPVQQRLTSVDWVLGWAARALRIPLLDWPEILSEWHLRPDNHGGRYAITHPHRPDAPPANAQSTSVRRWGPERLVPGGPRTVLRAPMDTPLDIEPP